MASPGASDTVGVMVLRPHRGFTLVEVIVVLLLIGFLLVVTVTRLDAGDGRADDQSAQASLNSVLDSQLNAWRATGSLVAAPRIDGDNPEVTVRRAEVASRGPHEASMALRRSTSESVVAAASMGSTPGDDSLGTCWLVRRNLAPTPGEPPELYGFRDTNGADCTGQVALGMDSLGPGGAGRSFSEPREL